MKSYKLYVFIICIILNMPAIVSLSNGSINKLGFIDEGNIIYVDDDNIEGPWDGSPENPYQYIQDGINDANEGDVVIIFEGEYFGDGNRNLQFDESITLQSTNPEDPEVVANTVIDLEHEGLAAFQLVNDECFPDILGFTIRNSECLGAISSTGGNAVFQQCVIQYSKRAVSCKYSSEFRLINCTLLGNGETTNLGGAIYCQGDSYNPVHMIISDCIVVGNIARDGGGIYCTQYSTIEIANSEIIQNTAESGGGIYTTGNSAEIRLENSLINDNVVSVSGGGIYRNSGYFSITNSIVKNNRAEISGGGISYRCSISAIETSTIRDCRIENNQVLNGDGGGGIYFFDDGDDLLLLKNSIITNNSASRNNACSAGGGIFAHTSYPSRIIISQCQITNNTVYGYGGGISAGFPPLKDLKIRQGDYIQIYDSLITYNHVHSGIGTSVGGNGGGFFAINSEGLLCENTITNNVADNEGGGICIGYLWSPKQEDEPYWNIIDSIIWNNSAVYNQQIHIAGDNLACAISYSDIQDIDFTIWGDNNIADDPIFVDPDGPDNDPFSWDDNDYHLDSTSPCIDRGDPDFDPSSENLCDIDGQLRPIDIPWISHPNCGPVDIGADEFLNVNCCPWDVDGNGVVNPIDSGLVMAHFGPVNPATIIYDIDGNGFVNPIDSGLVMAHFGDCPNCP